LALNLPRGPASFAGGCCEQELGLHALGLERLLADWQRWIYF
jgi:hypothetical protein